MRKGVRMGKVDSRVIKTVKKFKSTVEKSYGIEDIILFGSFARGTNKGDSDIDLLVVVKKPVKKLVKKLLLEWHVSQHIDYPVDFISYTKEEFEKESSRITLANVALQEGIHIK